MGVNNLDNDPGVLIRVCTISCYDAFENNSIPAAELFCKYQYQMTFVRPRSKLDIMRLNLWWSVNSNDNNPTWMVVDLTLY